MKYVLFHNILVLIALAYAQTDLSHDYSYTQSMDVNEGSDKKKCTSGPTEYKKHGRFIDALAHIFLDFQKNKAGY